MKYKRVKQMLAGVIAGTMAVTGVFGTTAFANDQTVMFNDGGVVEDAESAESSDANDSQTLENKVEADDSEELPDSSLSRN